MAEHYGKLHIYAPPTFPCNLELHYNQSYIVVRNVYVNPWSTRLVTLDHLTRHLHHSLKSYLVSHHVGFSLPSLSLASLGVSLKEHGTAVRSILFITPSSIHALHRRHLWLSPSPITIPFPGYLSHPIQAPTNSHPRHPHLSPSNKSHPIPFARLRYHLVTFQPLKSFRGLS